MMSSMNAVVFLLTLYLTWLGQVEGDESSFEQTNECSTYSEKLASFPDLHNMIRYKERRYSDLHIDSVKNTNRERRFYWCELDIEESDTIYKRYRHYGFNSTHWWVEKGCGGWFWITECRPVVTSRKAVGARESYGGFAMDQRSDEEHHTLNLYDEDNDENDNTPWQNLDKMSPSLVPNFESVNIGSGQRITAKGSAVYPSSPPTALGWNQDAISSGRHDDRKMAYTSNKNAVEENAGHDGPRGSVKSDYADHVGIRSLQSPGGAQYDSAGYPDPTGMSAVVSSNSSIDDLYKGWPTVGYDYPTSNAMWEALDKATWVDVKAQLGFYTKYGGVNSHVFD